ncbi:MAG: dihydrofolate reductase family protein, partial [Armatimonadota bacterium]
MRKLVSLMHVSLDGFVAGPNGEMEWIKISEEIFDLAGDLTRQADTALYGRVTYDMMEAFWPTAADQPNPTKHIVEHSAWYEKVDKVVVSTTLSSDADRKRTVISDHVACGIKHLKEQDGTNILLLGSPSLTRMLIEADLIDEMWWLINPVILGQGIKMFPELSLPKNLTF